MSMDDAISLEKAAAPSVASPHRAWLAYLDGWRGLSVLAVLAGHFFPITPINTGRLGVETFFCLSGRLMAGILFVENYPLNRFILRRVARVWPALYMFVCIIALLFSARGPLEVKAIDIIGALTFTINYTDIYIHRTEVFDHLWSLSVEEWSYLFLTVLAFLSRKYQFSPIPTLLCLSVLCIVNGAVQTRMGLDYYQVYWRTDVRIASILLPCALFLLLKEKKFAPWLPVAAGLVGVACNLNRIPDPLKYSIGTGLLAFAVATIDVSPASIRKILSMPWLRMVGLWSFSLYLWQQPFAKTTGLPIMHLLFAFGCALTSFYVLEDPARRFLNKFSR